MDTENEKDYKTMDDETRGGMCVIVMVLAAAAASILILSVMGLLVAR
jgi:hypothetical protein